MRRAAPLETKPPETPSSHSVKPRRQANWTGAAAAVAPPPRRMREDELIVETFVHFSERRCSFRQCNRRPDLNRLDLACCQRLAASLQRQQQPPPSRPPATLRRGKRSLARADCCAWVACGSGFRLGFNSEGEEARGGGALICATEPRSSPVRLRVGRAPRVSALEQRGGSCCSRVVVALLWPRLVARRGGATTTTTTATRRLFRSPSYWLALAAAAAASAAAADFRTELVRESHGGFCALCRPTAAAQAANEASVRRRLLLAAQTRHTPTGAAKQWPVFRGCCAQPPARRAEPAFGWRRGDCHAVARAPAARPPLWFVFVCLRSAVRGERRAVRQRRRLWRAQSHWLPLELRTNLAIDDCATREQSPPPPILVLTHTLSIAFVSLAHHRRRRRRRHYQRLPPESHYSNAAPNIRQTNQQISRRRQHCVCVCLCV